MDSRLHRNACRGIPMCFIIKEPSEWRAEPARKTGNYAAPGGGRVHFPALVGIALPGSLSASIPPRPLAILHALSQGIPILAPPLAAGAERVYHNAVVSVARSEMRPAGCGQVGLAHGNGIGGEGTGYGTIKDATD